jgi:hypothetical protein
MTKGTPGARLPKWCSTIKHGVLLAINNHSVFTLADVTTTIHQFRQQQHHTLQFIFAVDKCFGLHPINSAPIIYWDQLNVISRINQDIINDAALSRQHHNHPDNDAASSFLRYISTPPDPSLSADFDAFICSMTASPLTTDHSNDIERSFTQKELQRRDDWPEWQASIYKQLNMYHDQGMFGDPTTKPENANALPSIWRFHLKHDLTKKARAVCNGSKHQKGTVTLGNTYANSVCSESECLFWALTAHLGLTAIAADVSNAFAEAPAPEAPLYLYIDNNFRDWWVNELKRDPIPSQFMVIRVYHAIQGHP